MKKTRKAPANKEDLNLEDILRNQISLYQYCNELNTRMHEMEMTMHNINFQTQMIKRDNFELKNLLSGLANHLKNLHDQERMSPKTDDSWLTDESSITKDQPIMRKALPLHDDVMMNCEVCGCNHHVNTFTCPKCGFFRLNKDGDGKCP